MVNDETMKSKIITGFLLCTTVLNVFLFTESGFADTVLVSGKKTFKIFHIMSYNSPWRWTDGQFNGFKEGMQGQSVEYKTFQMDTKRNNSAEAKGKEARELIETWKPDLVYATDDDAQEHVSRQYINKDVPIVFSSVNKDPKEYGFDTSSNITGVLEQEHFIESVNLLRSIKPEVKKIAAIFDGAPMWHPVIRRMRDRIKQLSGVQIVSWDTIRTFEEYKSRIAAYQTTADAIALIGIVNFKGADGKNVPWQDVLRWTAENSTLPDFSYWIDRVLYGTLCSVAVSEYEQGLAAGLIARSILVEGKSPAHFTIKPTIKGSAAINLARANKLGIKIKSGILLSSEIIQKFEWDK